MDEKFSILKNALQLFQVKRIAQTYSDFETQTEYTKLVRFFLNEIYGPQDYSFRNESIKSLHKKLKSLLSGEIIDSLGKVIELQELTDELDNMMVGLMIKNGITENFTQDEYNTFYQKCDNYSARVYQIDLMVDATKAIYNVSQMRLIGWSLKAVHSLTHFLGIGKIMDFLENGYEAFSNVKNIEIFTRSVHERETALNDRLYGKQ